MYVCMCVCICIYIVCIAYRYNTLEGTFKNNEHIYSLASF